MNVNLDDASNADGNYMQIDNTDVTIFRYFTMLLYFLLFCNGFCLFAVSFYFYKTSCEKCDFYNRILVVSILVKNLIHSNLTIIKIKRKEEIRNNILFRNIMFFCIKICNFFTFFLALVSLYFLHFYSNICSGSTLSLRLIKIYYYYTITLYFIPLLFYISIGLFLSIIICIMINFSVEESDRIPTPDNIISKLKVSKYIDLDYIQKKRSPNSKNKYYIKKPSFEMIFDRVKNVIIDKDNNEKKKNNNNKTQINDSNSYIMDENLQEMLKPLNANIENPNRNNNDGSNKPLQESLLNNNKEISNDNEDACSICMMDYINNDEVMIMPCDKRHFFHVNCLTKWLYKSQVCPICRTNVVNFFSSGGSVV